MFVDQNGSAAVGSIPESVKFDVILLLVYVLKCLKTSMCTLPFFLMLWPNMGTNMFITLGKFLFFLQEQHLCTYLLRGTHCAI